MPPHLHSKIADLAAAIGGPAVVALTAFTAIEGALKLLILLLTVIFISMGIAMRVMKIRKASIEEEEGD